MTFPARHLACAAAVGLFSLSGPANAGHHMASADIIDRGGQTIGTATFRQGSGGVLINVTVEGLTPGRRGMHLHEIGDCSNADFTSAGPHINPDGKAHGLLNADGPDNADLPNLIVGADGAVSVELFTPFVSLHGEDGRPALIDADGSSIVIHQNADDHSTQPIGGAGPRAACGVIIGE